jgi:hypothetical protein
MLPDLSVPHAQLCESSGSCSIELHGPGTCSAGDTCRHTAACRTLLFTGANAVFAEDASSSADSHVLAVQHMQVPTNTPVHAGAAV